LGDKHSLTSKFYIVEEAESNVTFGMYYNYADPTLSAPNAHKRYWLGNYERLESIKKAVDPDLLFMNPQTVGSHKGIKVNSCTELGTT
jgi:hypothetical protein